MPAALPTVHELEQQLISARGEVLTCDQADDTIGADLARLRCDALIERIQQAKRANVDI